MTTSKRLAERKVEKFEKNVARRGSTKKSSQYAFAHIILGVFAFVIVASYIFQMIRAALNDNMAA